MDQKMNLPDKVSEINMVTSVEIVRAEPYSWWPEKESSSVIELPDMKISLMIVYNPISGQSHQHGDIVFTDDRDSTGMIQCARDEDGNHVYCATMSGIDHNLDFLVMCLEMDET